MNFFHKSIIQNIHSIFSKILFLEKKRTITIGEIKLFPTEIHFILMIKSDSSTNATRIADKLRVTKGAVSQTVSRLEKKGIVTKTKDSMNRNEMTIEFTDAGNRVVDKLTKLKKHLDYSYFEILKNFSETECKVINNFMSELEKAVHKI